MIRLVCVLLLMLLSVPVSAGTFSCVGERQVAASYLAKNNDRLEACFDIKGNMVTLRLPDAAVVKLPAAISGSGARYSDELKTFWEHQGVGRYFVGEKLLFEGELAVAGGYKQGVSARTLIKTGVTANGARIVYPATDRAEVTALIVELAPGAETGWHKHTIPVYGYVQSGSIEVELEGGRKFVYKAGDAIIEVVDSYHNGRNKGTVPVNLVVFYTGIQGVSNVVKRP